MSPTATGFTAEEIDRMRAILAQHDQQNGGMNGIKEFDLNNPPVKPYSHQAFPLHLTNKAGKVRIAKNEEEAAKLAKRGFLSPEEYRTHVASLTPPEELDQDPDDDGIELAPEAAAEAAELDAKLKAPKTPKAAKPKPE